MFSLRKSEEDDRKFISIIYRFVKLFGYLIRRTKNVQTAKATVPIIMNTLPIIIGVYSALGGANPRSPTVPINRVKAIMLSNSSVRRFSIFLLTPTKKYRINNTAPKKA